MEEILDGLTLPELFALHNKLANDIKGIRRTQGLISQVIRSKELAAQAPSAPAHLTQSIEVKPNGQ